MEINHAWELTGQRRHAEALAALAALSARQPESRDVLYLQAMNLRIVGRTTEALDVLDRLACLHPRFSRLYQERGQCCWLLKDAAGALEALLQAVALNAALPVSWGLLQRLYGMAGDARGAAEAARQLDVLKRLPPEVIRASSLFADGDLLPAENLIRTYLCTDEHNAGALRLLARILLSRAALDEAEAVLSSVLRRAPDFHAARLDHAMVLLRQRRYQQSRDEALTLLRHDPDNREYLKQYGAACLGLNDHEPVIGLYEKLLAGMPPSGPEVSDLRLWRGNALRSTGRHPEAVADYRAAVTARPESGVAWFSLANLKTYRFADDEVACMRAVESTATTSDPDRCYLCFALGKAFEDRGDYATSWHYYARGNALRRAEGDYRPETTERAAQLQRQHATAAFFAARAGWGIADTAPIFVLGLPRSGSTLIEQILASHPQVEGTQELTEIDRYAAELISGEPSRGRGPWPEAMQRLTAEDARRLGERFLRDTRPYRRLGRAFFVDKMPDNLWHIGLIQLILPRATIIDARREPMGCCVGNLKQLFGSGTQPFAYDVDDLARYYRTYLALMHHWHEVLPGRILTVHHEDVVRDLEGSVRRMLRHCGLPFEPACVDFHLTRRSVHSASSEQVRQPIRPETVEHWRHFEPWLGPLKNALGDAVSRYRD